jgi:hypothetical protein
VHGGLWYLKEGVVYGMSNEGGRNSVCVCVRGVCGTCVRRARGIKHVSICVPKVSSVFSEYFS